MAKLDEFDTIQGLYPDEFDITTEQGRKGLNSWKDKSVVSIVDPGLEYPEEYQESRPSYLGQYVVTCNLCHVPSFLTREGLEEVFTCPHCSEFGYGFEVAGIVSKPEDVAVSDMEKVSDGTVNDSMADLVDEQAIEAETEIVLESLTEDEDDESIEDSIDTETEAKPAEDEKYKLVIIDEMDEKLTKATIKFSADGMEQALKKAVSVTLDPQHKSVDFDSAISSLEDEQATSEYWTEETLTDFLNSNDKVISLCEPNGDCFINKEQEMEEEPSDDEPQDVLEEGKKFNTKMGTVGKEQGKPSLVKEAKEPSVEKKKTVDINLNIKDGDDFFHHRALESGFPYKNLKHQFVGNKLILTFDSADSDAKTLRNVRDFIYSNESRIFKKEKCVLKKIALKESVNTKLNESIEITNDDIKQGFVYDPKTGKRLLLDMKGKILKEGIEVTNEDIKKGFVLTEDNELYVVGKREILKETKFAQPDHSIEVERKFLDYLSGIGHYTAQDAIHELIDLGWTDAEAVDNLEILIRDNIEDEDELNEELRKLLKESKKPVISKASLKESNRSPLQKGKSLPKVKGSKEAGRPKLMKENEEREKVKDKVKELDPNYKPYLGWQEEIERIVALYKKYNFSIKSKYDAATTYLRLEKDYGESKATIVMKELGSKYLVEELKRLKEDIDVNIKTDQKVNVNIDEDGDSVESYEEPMEEMNDNEVIRPLSDEEAMDLEGLEGLDLEEAYVNKLIGKFLTENYGNVTGYKTDKVAYDRNKNLIIEGKISYKSGAKANTQFIFENFNMNSKAQIVKGSNKMFGRGKSFEMKTAMKENKVICEGLKYNYTTRDSKGCLFQVKGRV